jgi:hypothetical protein
MRKTVSTDELLADEFILDIKGRQQQTLDPREAKRQQSAQNRRRKQDEMRRTTFAVDMARKEREDMVRNEFLQLVHVMQHKKHFSFNDFLQMEKRLTDPYFSEVMVENVPYKIFANHKESGAFNAMVINTIQEKFLGSKHIAISEDNQNQPQSKKARTHGDSLGRRQVPTHLAEDGIVCREKLFGYDGGKNKMIFEREKQKLQNEQKTLQIICADAEKLKESMPRTYWNVLDSRTKSHVIVLYRLFDGPAYSNKNMEEMKCYLRNPRLIITKETTDHKIQVLHLRQSEIQRRMDEISAHLK